MSVPESAPVGSVVGRIWAKDRDIGVNAEMKYSIINGDGRDTFDISTDPTNLFGIITVKKVCKETDQSIFIKIGDRNCRTSHCHSSHFEIIIMFCFVFN